MPILLLHVHVSLECNYMYVDVRSCKVRSLLLMCVVYCKVTVEDKSMLKGFTVRMINSFEALSIWT